jgi:putative sterol carrier protein
MAFANAEDIYTFFDLMLEGVKKDEALYNKLANTGIVLTQKISDMDAAITLECKGSIKATYGPTDIKADSTTSQTSDVFQKFWQGKLNLMMAMAKGQVKASGAMTKMLKLLPLTNPIYKIFIETAKAIGREDLLVK